MGRLNEFAHDCNREIPGTPPQEDEESVKNPGETLQNRVIW